VILIHGLLRPFALLFVLVLLLAACADEGDDDPSAPGGALRDEEPEASEPTPPPSAEDDTDVDGDDEPDEEEAAPGHAEPDPVAEPYEPVAGEVRPNAKRLASRIVERLTTYEVDESPTDVVAELADGELGEQLHEAAAPLLHDDAWSRGRVVYPQLGGMLDDATSVMVVVEQTVGLPDGEVLEQSRTLDVRLTLREGAWAFDELASAGGEPVPRPDDLPEVAAAVLDDERIDLPDTAVWDIHRGGVDEELLTLMSRMADRMPYGVIVLDTGHPWEIFGTDRQSKHTMGQAVDIHAVGPEDTLVIEDRLKGSVTHELVRWVYDQPELSEVGSPWALDGFGGRSFSDQLHQDHLHVAVGDR
jgi:hypothetical protein